MNTERISQRLGSETSKKSVNTDTYLKINLDGEQKVLPPDVINQLVNVGDRFNTERQRSKYYRILGTINPSITNALFNLADSQTADIDTWSGFNAHTSLSPADYFFYDSVYPNVVNKYLKEIDGWFGYYDPDISKSGFCIFYDMEPKRQRFSFTPDINPYHSALGALPVKNWEMTITYPASVDSGHTMVNNGFINGLMMIETTPVIISNRQMTAIGLACFHNLSIGDIVRISGTNGYDGDHVVIRTGLDNGDFKPYYFVIDLPFVGNSFDGNSRIKKSVNGVDSIYYFRKFKKIKTRSTPVIEQDDYEVYKLAFSENYFNDDITQFTFNEDVDVSGLVDNLGRPLSELYLTMVKTNSNNLFGNVSSGIEAPFLPVMLTNNFNTYLTDIPIINRIHNGGTSPFQSHTPLESNLTIAGGTLNSNEFYGDLVEYNESELRETVLADVSHRFNTLNRETLGQTMSYFISETSTNQKTISLGPRQEGYMYKPHSLIKIREFSAYVEQGDEFTVGIPNYAIKIDNSR